LTKSITAFKSLRFLSTGTGTVTTTTTGQSHTVADGHTLVEATKWIDLLVKEIVSRVDRDTQRNERYPKNLVIQYYSHNNTNTKYSHQNNKSIRILYPSYQLPNDERIRMLRSIVPNTLQEKVISRQKSSSSFRFHRIGLCATDFESIKSGSKGIDTYFSVATSSSSSTATIAESNNIHHSKCNFVETSTSNQKLLSSPLPANCGKELINMAETLEEKVSNGGITIVSNTSSNTTLDNAADTCAPIPAENVVVPEEESDDFVLARKLQDAYDHEDRALRVMEKKRNNTLSSMNHKKQRQPPVRKINSFFQKKS
jgi:hypothetical protein